VKGGITMSTLSIHPVEYLRLHVRYEEIRTRLLRAVRSLVKKVFESSDQAATCAVVLLIVGLVIFGCMKIGESASVIASYNSVITEIVLPPLQAVPTGM
jgi:spore maturation protein SpmA